eukprot:g10998.t1
MKTKTGSQEMNGERGGLRGSKQLLRLEVRVEGPELGSAALRAPLTGRSCVLHSAAVSKQLHDGMPAVPVAFSASSVDFTVTLVDDKETCQELMTARCPLCLKVGGIWHFAHFSGT